MRMLRPVRHNVACVCCPSGTSYELLLDRAKFYEAEIRFEYNYIYIYIMGHDFNLDELHEVSPLEMLADAADPGVQEGEQVYMNQITGDVYIEPINHPCYCACHGPNLDGHIMHRWVRTLKPGRIYAAQGRDSFVFYDNHCWYNEHVRVISPLELLARLADQLGISGVA